MRGASSGRIAALAVALAAVSAGAQTLAAARSAAGAGRVDAAIEAAQSALKADAANAAAIHSLLCGLHGSIEERDQAITECEAASAAAPNSSMYALDLARVYGSKADHSGPLTGMRMVGKIRSNFERAVALDGRNVEALSDLGEFYVDAPGMVGGGTDKAKALVMRLTPLSLARAHRLRAMIDAKEKDDAGSAEEYTAEIAAAATPEAYYDLAAFYRSHKQLDKAVQNAVQAIQHDVHHGPDTLDAAALLIELKREIPVAQEGLRGYLAAPQTGVAWYPRAHVLLGNSLQATGDAAGAQKEYAAALALASHYDAARKASHA